MDKRTKERLEREKLKQMIESNPKLKAFLDASVEETGNQELKDLIEPVLADTFDKIRMQGIQIGWYSHAMLVKDKIKDCKTIEEAMAILDADAQISRDNLGIKEEEDG